MQIDKKTINASIERDIITAMIVDAVFIQQIQLIIRLDLFQAPFVKTVAKWCMDYYMEFEEAPSSTIQNIFESYKPQLNEEQSDIILTFLASISDEYERKTFNSAFILKEAEVYFKKQSLLELSNDIKADISRGKIEEAELKRLEFNQVVAPTNNIVSVFTYEAVEHAFNAENHQVLFRLPGALGELVQPFRRMDFVALAAVMKFGKSYVLIDWAVRAGLAGCNVLFFSLEMGLEEVELRYYQSVLGDKIVDLENYNPEWYPDNDVIIPYFDEDGDLSIKIKERKGMTQSQMNKKIKAMNKLSGIGEVKLCCEPAYTVNTTVIENKLTTERILNGFIPDVIVIDYADIMMPEIGSSKEERHKINFTWVKLRALAQKYNCCVIVATQSNRKALKKDFEQDDMSEDIRKLAHPTRVVAMNKGVSSGEEDELAKEHAYRFNVLAQRRGYFNPEKFVRVLKCLAIGKPCLDSRWV